MPRLTRFDKAVILLVVLVAVAITTKFAYFTLTGVYVYEFSTTQAAKQFVELKDRGFPVEVEVEGVATRTREPITLRGLVTLARGGTLVFITKDGWRVSAGGRYAIIENIAAEKVVLRPLNMYTTILVYEEYQLDDVSDLVNIVAQIEERIKPEYAYVDGGVALIGTGEIEASFYQSFLNATTNGIQATWGVWPDPGRGKGVYLSLENAPCKAVLNLERLLPPNDGAVFSDVRITLVTPTPVRREFLPEPRPALVNTIKPGEER
ncbi:MAG: hypothetical protein DRO11_03600 [Methanobacteriota archaeon]|nr:MAG: hypothetical protein DRO11_03600 [Euryarchaeota archaeon]